MLLFVGQLDSAYPYLSSFARETSWRCGKRYIPIKSNCYTNPKTGKPTYTYKKNPITGRRNKVKVAFKYKDYRKARAEAVKRIGKGQRITNRQYQYLDDVDKLKRSIKPVTNTKTHLNILKAEDKLSTQKFETLKIFTKKGIELSSTDGQADKVYVPVKDIIKIKNNIITHNHPFGLDFDLSHPLSKGSSFSYEDVMSAATQDAAEIRAVSRGYRHSLKRPVKGWGYLTDINQAYKMSQKVVVNYFDELINAEGVRNGAKAARKMADIATAEHNHKIMKLFSYKTGAKYVREIFKRV